ncbi:glucuronyl hydrolase [Flavobacteriaceae bacterium TP-CH-4]|uniref:Glucuronyl hydrolase n=2 Tax=Pelagihabitans pacificus TaxID=2696054 RepID=A0A967ASV2_9FLAO|nr:glucuronyl hydrolase [Pelagihabitans pacificus]
MIACNQTKKAGTGAETLSIDSVLQIRYQKLLEYPLDSTKIPRSYTKSASVVRGVPSKDWTSGFFAGNLWHLYRLTGDDNFKNRAMRWTTFIEKEKFNDGTHDMGFKIFCSFGEGLKVEDNQVYKDIILQSAKTLSTRFNENVGSLRSWDFNKDVWEFPVIVDNMMNLELLFIATRMSGDSTFHEIAVQHANTTLKNHFRDDHSSVHVVVYDTISGAVKEKVTHQGFNAESAWARGQAWGIYGFTMCYRYTRDPAYLAQAEASAQFFIDHPNLPEDGVPYWDFNDPAIPEAPRDVSAAAIVASALLELSKYTENSAYQKYSEKVLESLRSDKYVLEPSLEIPFILDHSTGNWPANDEIDVPIVYADYYFLEAMIRRNEK